jgi:hypothetical protein
MIDEIFVTQAHSKQPMAEQLFNGMLDPPRIPVVAKTLCQAADQPGSLLDFPQQQDPGVRGDVSPLRISRLLFSDLRSEIRRSADYILSS